MTISALNRMEYFTCKKLDLEIMYKGCAARYWMMNISSKINKDETLRQCVGCKKGKEIYDALNK